MGMEMWYVAVADGCHLLKRSLSDRAFVEYLGSPGYFGRERWRHNYGDLDAEFLAEVDEMNRLHPGIEGRIYTLDRYFDMLHYLLSEGRRRGEPGGADLGRRSILGGMSLPEHIRGGQGHLIRYTPPAEVGEIAAWLEGQTVAHLRSAYSPTEMERQGVYKYWADRADEQTWDRIIGYFEGLRSFYAGVALHSEGVLVVVT
ncbi:DUF1877 family protein [Singulisphaera sp. Ch08]|uniref:DUF1877 family protein n=1 Tax=Singulisphaera sp. Ch08 TaxID=3120278 RepID=A0AAU7CEK8_9BACT